MFIHLRGRFLWSFLELPFLFQTCFFSHEVGSLYSCIFPLYSFSTKVNQNEFPLLATKEPNKLTQLYGD